MKGRRADINFHLLPGVDEGAANLEETVELARLAEIDGTGVIVATPHVRSDFLTGVSHLPDRVAEVRARLALEDIDIDVRCGGELGHDMVGRLGQSDLDTIAVGPAGSSWILLESPFEGLGEELHAAADELRDRGFAVVLAHPQRSAVMMADNAAALRRELARGSLLQVNAWSLAGGAGVVCCLASDAHPGWRGPALGVGLEKASWALSWARARILTDSAPRALLERGAPLVAPAA
jgi:protein-tyrosine phosphatase